MECLISEAGLSPSTLPGDLDNLPGGIQAPCSAPHRCPDDPGAVLPRASSHPEQFPLRANGNLNVGDVQQEVAGLGWALAIWSHFPF